MNTFLIITIAIALCGGFSIRVFAQKIMRTPSWSAKIFTAIPVMIQAAIIIGTCVLLAYLLSHPDINSVEKYMSTLIYSVSIFILALIFFLAVAMSFHGHIARHPYRTLKSVGVFVLCVAFSCAVLWLLRSA